MGSQGSPPGNVLNNAELIRAAYIVLLGREPESEDVIRQKTVRSSDPVEILRSFVDCDEYLAKQNSFSALLGSGLTARRERVDVRVPASTLDALFARTQRQWQALGVADPYWSVLTHEKFRMTEIDKNMEEFNASGKLAADLMDYTFERSGAARPGGVCLELGCGVGRITRFLASRFERLLAADISEGNLRICRQYLDSVGLNNVETILLKSPQDLLNLPAIDMFFSVIVLQHNPPPVIKYVLDTILQKINTGGAAYFQVPTHAPNYAFDVDAYLADPEAVLDMHCLPMFEVFDSFKDAGFVPREVQMDVSTGSYGSHKFLAMRL